MGGWRETDGGEGRKERNGEDEGMEGTAVADSDRKDRERPVLS